MQRCSSGPRRHECWCAWGQPLPRGPAAPRWGGCAAGCDAAFLSTVAGVNLDPSVRIAAAACTRLARVAVASITLSGSLRKNEGARRPVWHHLSQQPHDAWKPTDAPCGARSLIAARDSPSAVLSKSAPCRPNPRERLQAPGFGHTRAGVKNPLRNKALRPQYNP